MDKFEAAGLYCGLGVLWLLALGVSVIRQRLAKQISLGDGDDPVLQRRMRAHANATEWMTPGLIALWGLALLPAAPLWLLHAGAGTLFVGRVLHGFGLGATGGPSPPRLIGMVLTITAYIILGGGLIWASLTGAAV